MNLPQCSNFAIVAIAPRNRIELGYCIIQPLMIAFFNGYHIRQLRLKMGFGQAGFASLLGVLPGTLSRWETGDSVPGYAAIPALLILLFSHEVISLPTEK